MLELITTVGGADSNSYGSLEEADEYHTARLHSEVWTDADDETKKAALIMATSLLDTYFEWNGLLTSANTQALRFPRWGVFNRDGWQYDSAKIPEPIKKAQFELARLLIDSDRFVEDANRGVSSVKVGPIDVDFDKEEGFRVIPDHVVQIVRHLGEVKQFGATVRGGSVGLTRA